MIVIREWNACDRRYGKAVNVFVIVARGSGDISTFRELSKRRNVAYKRHPLL